MQYYNYMPSPFINSADWTLLRGILCLITQEERAPILITSSNGMVEAKWVKQERYPYREVGGAIMNISSILCIISVIVYMVIRRKKKFRK